VVAIEPNLRERTKAVVVRDLIRWEMTVIVDDRQRLCHGVKKPPRCLGLKQEVFVNKRLH
jgi:hypothetical protein